MDVVLAQKAGLPQLGGTYVEEISDVPEEVELNPYAEPSTDKLMGSRESVDTVA